MQDIILIILDVLGTISFAISGALVAIKQRLDIFGVAFVGTITAVGGGVLRDILIGKFPPTLFSKLYIFFIAIATCATVFVITYINRAHFDRFREKVEHINNVFDAIGLAAFSVMGTEVAFASGSGDNAFLSITLGMLTGIGGGIIRDILTDTTPYVFKKHVYALASIFGAGLYYTLKAFIGNPMVATFVPMLAVFVIRMLATKYRWSLPKIKFDNK